MPLLLPRGKLAVQTTKTMILKNILLLLGAAVLMCAAGCTAMQEVGTDVSEKFDDGLTGRGRLVSPGTTGNSFGSYYD